MSPYKGETWLIENVQWIHVLFADKIYSGVDNGRVLTKKLYTHRIQM